MDNDTILIYLQILPRVLDCSNAPWTLFFNQIPTNTYTNIINFN
jgi:hypothetical protein